MRCIFSELLFYFKFWCTFVFNCTFITCCLSTYFLSLNVVSLVHYVWKISDCKWLMVLIFTLLSPTRILVRRAKTVILEARFCEFLIWPNWDTNPLCRRFGLRVFACQTVCDVCCINYAANRCRTQLDWRLMTSSLGSHSIFSHFVLTSFSVRRWRQPYR